MSAFLNQVAASDHRLLWIDDSEYSAKLLAADAAPWLDTSAYVAWRRKAQSLLNSSVAALPVARVCDALLAKDGRMRAAMGAKSRAGYPLKTLLSSEALRRQVAELLVGLRSSFPALSLALVCPSPRSWVTEAHRLAFGNGTTVIVGEEEVDSATMHCADFLREFAGTGIDTVLLEESPESEPQGASELEWYRSVLNVGAHYRWDMGLRMPGPGHLGGAIADIAYLISTRVESGVCCGELIPAQFWSGAPFEGSPRAAFRFVQIPPHIQPEVVLDRLASLR
jgi:hypothetical protein